MKHIGLSSRNSAIGISGEKGRRGIKLIIVFYVQIVACRALCLT
jgi:hypothetical protein